MKQTVFTLTKCFDKTLNKFGVDHLFRIIETKNVKFLARKTEKEVITDIFKCRDDEFTYSDKKVDVVVYNGCYVGLRY